MRIALKPVTPEPSTTTGTFSRASATSCFSGMQPGAPRSDHVVHSILGALACVGFGHRRAARRGVRGRAALRERREENRTANHWSSARPAIDDRRGTHTTQWWIDPGLLRILVAPIR